jgi:hypothetical protein
MIFKSMVYDESLKIGSDYKLNLKLFLQNTSFSYIDKTIAVYSMNGISSLNIKKSRLEECAVRSQVLPLPLATILNLIKKIKWMTSDWSSK